MLKQVRDKAELEGLRLPVEACEDELSAVIGHKSAVVVFDEPRRCLAWT